MTAWKSLPDKHKEFVKSFQTARIEKVKKSIEAAKKKYAAGLISAPTEIPTIGTGISRMAEHLIMFVNVSPTSASTKQEVQS
ncbi:MAG: hypothetical protein IPH59_01400 [bacterium]|nr:hypothetical protein [bacterium]